MRLPLPHPGRVVLGAAGVVYGAFLIGAYCAAVPIITTAYLAGQTIPKQRDPHDGNPEPSPPIGKPL